MDSDALVLGVGERVGGSFGSGVIRGGPAPPPPLPTTECPANLETSCYFSVAAPSQVTIDAPFLVELWCHPETPMQFMDVLRAYSGRAQHLRSQGPLQVERGVTMDVELVLQGFAVDDPHGTMRWESRTGVIGFPVRAGAETSAGTHLGTARVSVGGLRIAAVHFQVELSATVHAVADQTAGVERIDSAFASYASEDRHRVLGRIQGMQKVLQTLDIFLDVLTLRSGDRWAQRLEDEIRTRDVFFLFWSRAARASRWVDHEWRTALAVKGLEAINPVPLEDPTLAPPPPELESLHFRDWSLALMKEE